MIIKYEIEQFIKEIEAKLPQLEGKAHEKALEKVAVLSRVNIEFMEYEDMMRKVATMNSKANIEILKLWKKIDEQQKEIDNLKENIQ